MSLTTILKLCLVAVLIGAYSAQPLEEEEVTPRPLISGCTVGPLGMASGEIPDSAITASSSYSSTRLPIHARPNSGGWWHPTSCGTSQWLQVDLGGYTAATGVQVTGASADEFVRTFTVRYSMTGESDDWQSLTDTEGRAIAFQGNTASALDTVTVTFPSTLMTRFVRLQMASWSRNCHLGLELLGCRAIDGLVRLVDGDGKRSGRVEILHDRGWGAICDNGWDMREARIVCHQLGFLEAEEATNVTLEDSEEEELAIVMNRVSCKGSEKRLVDCPFVCSSIQQCDSSRVAGVTCKPNIIRLVGGSNHTNGRVEIYQDNEWGTLCDTDWDVTDAEVVCHQLGFSGAVEAKSGAHFGQGEGPVYMDGLACDGSESKITDCPSFCWEEVACNHTQDAGVVCREEGVETVTVGDTIPLQ